MERSLPFDCNPRYEAIKEIFLIELCFELIYLKVFSLFFYNVPDFVIYFESKLVP